MGPKLIRVISSILASRIISSFFKQLCNLFFGGFHVSPFSVGLKVLGWSGSQQEMADLGGFDVVAGPPSCQGTALCWSTLKGGFGTQLNTHVIYSPEN